MTENERRFRRVINRIGIAMLLFVAIINVASIIWSICTELLYSLCDPLTANVLNELGYCIMYLSSFMAPAFILRALLGNDYKPMMLEKKVPIDAAAYIVAAITVAYSFAYLNSYLVSIFNYSEFSSEYLWDSATMDNCDTVLAFIGTAIVPAICEEFLFRGAILSALKPYGKMPAIVISSVLFGLMHQNSEQFLYTTVAGLLMGWVAYETGAIWCSMLIHFFNNFISVIETVLYERIDVAYVSVAMMIFEGILFLSGIAAIAYLIIKHVKKKRSLVLLNDGIYKKELTELTEDADARIKLSPGRVTRLFFSPAMIAFIAISGATMAFYILQSILYSMGVSII